MKKKQKSQTERIAAILGRCVRHHRQARGLTQRELADRTGMSITFLQNIESGRRWVGTGTIAQLAEHLEVTEHALFVVTVTASEEAPSAVGKSREASAAVYSKTPRATPVSRGADVDPRELLVLISRSLGVSLPPKAARRLRVVDSQHVHFRAMPPDIYRALRELCRSTRCDWPALRRHIRGLGG